MMTREEVLAQMEASYETMQPEDRNEVLFSEGGTDYSPTLLLQAVRDNTEFGQKYVTSWSVNQDSIAREKVAMERLLDLILGPIDPNAMTCGDPDCPNCKGEVRPFGQVPEAPESGTRQLH